MYILTAFEIDSFPPHYRHRIVDIDLSKSVTGVPQHYYAVIINPAEYALLVLQLDIKTYYETVDKRGIFLPGTCTNGVIEEASYESKKYYNDVVSKLCT